MTPPYFVTIRYWDKLDGREMECSDDESSCNSIKQAREMGFVQGMALWDRQGKHGPDEIEIIIYKREKDGTFGSEENFWIMANKLHYKLTKKP
jgi:hypothetical protein